MKSNQHRRNRRPVIHGVPSTTRAGISVHCPAITRVMNSAGRPCPALGGLHPQPILPRGAPIGPRNAQAAPPLSAAVHIRPTVPEQGGGTKATCRGTDWPRLFVDQAARGASSTRCRRVHLVLQYGATGRLTRGTEHTPAGSARPWTATPFPCNRPRAQQLTARSRTSTRRRW